MKQLYKNGETPTQIFFTIETTLQQICDWINKDLETSLKLLDVNEWFYGNATVRGDEIIISCNDNSITFTIEIVNPIRIN